MKKLIKKINIFVLLIVGLVCTGIVYAASGTPLGSQEGEATLSFEAYNCSSFVSSDSDTNGMYNCIDAYFLGNLSTMRLNDNDSIDASSEENGNKYIFLVSKFSADSEDLVRTMDTSILYNNDALSVMTIDGAYGYVETTDYPYDQVYQRPNYINTNKFSVGITNPYFEELDQNVIKYVIYTMNTDTTFGLNQNQNLAYHFLKVNEDAEAGSTLAFTWGSQYFYSDAARVETGDRVWLNGEGLTLKVSGGTTSSDNTLKIAKTSQNGDVYPFSTDTPFVPGVANSTYMTFVPSAVDDIDFDFTANDAGASITAVKVTGDGAGDFTTLTDSDEKGNIFSSEDNTLSIGLNKFKVTVVAADGTPEVYEFNVYRLSNVTTLSNLTADGIELTASANGLVYTGTTPYSDKDTTLYITPTHAEASVVEGAEISWTFDKSGTDVNEKKFTVQAENCKYVTTVPNASCTTQVYTVQISRESPSNNAYLSMIKTSYGDDATTNLGVFTQEELVYDLGSVSYATEYVNIEGVLAEPTKATFVSGESGHYALTAGQTNTFTIVTKAEDGVTSKTYTVKVYRRSNNTLLKSIDVTSLPSTAPTSTLNPVFQESYTGRYKYSYDSTVQSVSITAKVKDIGKSKIAIVDATSAVPGTYTSTLNETTASFNLPATTKVAIIVTSEDLNESTNKQIYYIDLERQQSSTSTLSNLVVEYTQGGEKKTATLDPTFSEIHKPYNVTIPSDVDSVVVKPTKKSPYASVVQIGDTVGVDLTEATISNIGFTPVEATIKIKPESGDEGQYYLTITRTKYSIKTLDSLSIGENKLDKTFTSGENDSTKEEYTYTENIPYSTTSINISGTRTNEYATVSVSVTDEKGNVTNQTIVNSDSDKTFSGSVDLPTGVNKVNVLVTAHDATTKVYEFTVTREKNNDATVKTIVVDGQIDTPDYNEANHEYTVTVPFNTMVLNPSQIAVQPNDYPKAQYIAGSSVTGLSTTEYKTYSFSVKAENGFVQDYTLKIIKKANDQAILTRATAKVGEKNYYCDVTTGSAGCTIAVPVNTSSAEMTYTVSENASVTADKTSPVGMNASDSSVDIKVTVVSEDASDSNVYTITLERAKSSNNDISLLKVNDAEATYNSSTNEYKDVEGGTVSSVTVTVTVDDIGKSWVSAATVNGASVSVTGNKTTGIYSFDSGTLNYGDNKVVITVTAENEQIQRHNLTIVRQQNVAEKISKLYFGAGSDEPTELTDWDSTQSTYTFNDEVSYDTNSITLIAYPEDSENGTAMVTSVKNEANVVTSTNLANLNTEGNAYKVVVPLSTGTNTITLVGYAHNTEINKTYTLTIIRTKNSDNVVSNLKIKGVDVITDPDNEGKYKVVIDNQYSTINKLSDITYTLPDGATATITGFDKDESNNETNTKTLLTKTDNYIKLTVMSENGTPNIYDINVIRKSSENADLTRVTLTIVASDATNNGKKYTCNFDTSDDVSCTIDVPSTTTGYSVAVTKADSTSTYVIENGATQSMDATTSTKTVNIDVTPEVGAVLNDVSTVKRYTILVNRAKSTNTNLATLTINGVTPVNFTPSGSLYRYEVEGNVDEVTIAATVEDTGKASINNAADFENPVTLSDFGENQIVIEVKPEDYPNTSIKNVTIIVNRKLKTDATLKEIKIDDVDITELDYTMSESDGVITYTINSEYAYTKTSVNVSAVTNDTDARVTSGVGVSSLKTGSNTIQITVYAHDTTVTKTYKLVLSRAKNSSTALRGITLANKAATYNEETGYWEVTVPNSVDKVIKSGDGANITFTAAAGATVNDKLATVELVNEETALSTKTVTDVLYTVTAEDGTVEANIPLKVTREKSTISTLHTLVVTDGSFKPSFTPDDATAVNYEVIVPESKTTIEISATPTNSEATIVTGTGTFNLASTNTTFQIHVTSEEQEVGKKTDTYYTLTVKRAESSVNTLSKVTVSSGSVDAGNLVNYDIYDEDTNVLVADGGYAAVTHYVATVPGDIEKVNLNAITTDSRASIENVETTLGEKTLTVGNNKFNIRVKSESGTGQTYSINIIRLQKTNNKLSNIQINDEDLEGFDPSVLDYDLGEVDNTTATIKIGATASDADARVISGTGTKDLTVGENNLEIVVRAQDGTDKTYTIKVTRKPSEDNRLSSLSVQGYQMTPSYSYVAPPSEEAKDYYVTIGYAKNTFSKSDIFARAHNNTATITYSDEISLDNGETKSFYISVTSQAGITNIYTIHVTRSLSDNAYLSGVNITAGESTFAVSPFNKTKTEYTISIPFGVDKFTISGTPEVDTTTIYGNNVEYDVATTNEVTLVTYAQMYNENGTEEEKNATMTYTFTINQAQSNNAYLSNLTVTGYPFVGEHKKFSQAYTDYDIGDIDSSVTGLKINATAENANATITYTVNSGSSSTSSTVSLPSGIGAGVITIEVMAPDGITTVPYTIAYNKVKSKNAYLASLDSSTGTFSPEFIKTTREYLLSVGSEVENITLTMFTESRLANIKINDMEDAVSATDIRPYEFTISDLSVGDTTVTILVTAQDSSVAQTYTVVIRKPSSSASSDATLSSLSVKDYPFVVSGSYTQTTFVKDVSDYSIGKIPYSVDKLKLEYETTQGESITSVLVNGTNIVPDSDGYVTIPKANTDNGLITIVVIAPNGVSSKTYNIHYTKQANDNPHLSNIVVSEGNIEFNKTKTNYTVELPSGTTTETITVTVEASTSTLTVGGEEKHSPYAHVLTALSDGNYTVSFIVTAENGDTLTYYVTIKVGAGNESITSITYGHVIEDGYIKSAVLNHTVAQMKSELDNEDSKLEIWNAADTAIVPDSQKIATGMIVKLIINGVEKDRKIIVVKGDTNGDGKLGLMDVVAVLNHYVEDPLLTGAYWYAGDYDTNGKVNLMDVVAILNAYVEQ